VYDGGEMRLEADVEVARASSAANGSSSINSAG
jgi:hypothetical protein